MSRPREHNRRATTTYRPGEVGENLARQRVNSRDSHARGASGGGDVAARLRQRADLVGFPPLGLSALIIDASI